MSSDIISVNEAAQMLKGHPHFVYSLILKGVLKNAGSGSIIRLSRSAVEKYRREHPDPGRFQASATALKEID
jgi:excisionase family DNA binding protein